MFCFRKANNHVVYENEIYAIRQHGEILYFETKKTWKQNQALFSFNFTLWFRE
jgi:hypothetical protein